MKPWEIAFQIAESHPRAVLRSLSRATIASLFFDCERRLPSGEELDEIAVMLVVFTRPSDEGCENPRSHSGVAGRRRGKDLNTVDEDIDQYRLARLWPGND